MARLAKGKFENYVNYAGSKTNTSNKPNHWQFENYVNYAGSKTQTDEENDTSEV